MDFVLLTGAPKKEGSVLMQIVEFNKYKQELSHIEAELERTERQINSISKEAERSVNQ